MLLPLSSCDLPLFRTRITTCYYPYQAATDPQFVPGVPLVTHVELRLALTSYQDYHILLLTLAGLCLWREGGRPVLLLFCTRIITCYTGRSSCDWPSFRTRLTTCCCSDSNCDRMLERMETSANASSFCAGNVFFEAPAWHRPPPHSLIFS